jgi:hypothetical protein
MRRALVALALAAVLVAAGVGVEAGAETLRCPSELVVNEQPLAPPGMRAEAAQRTRQLSGITVFDGMPSEKKELRPRRAGDAQVFDLPNPRLRPAILLCRYADTAVTLSAPLPTTIARCTLRGADGPRARQQVACD